MLDVSFVRRKLRGMIILCYCVHLFGKYGVELLIGRDCHGLLQDRLHHCFTSGKVGG